MGQRMEFGIVGRVDFEVGMGWCVAASETVLAPIEALRPTQMSVGMRAVKSKRRKFENRAGTGKRREKALSGRPIPTVRGPAGELFIIDHHHFCLALWQAEIQFAYAHILEDLSHLSPAAFWRRMEADGRLYPFDEEGRRVRASCLPTWLHALRHDPYRDLAGDVRDAGGYRKSKVPYAEFQWANFLRRHISNNMLRRNPDAAIATALKLAHNAEAMHLPGFVGRTR
jgi:hypothetical protein